MRRTGSVDIYTGAGAEGLPATSFSSFSPLPPPVYESSFRSSGGAAASAAEAGAGPTIRLTSELPPQHHHLHPPRQETATPRGASTTQAASASVTASSKAVLGALRALQEKIRRLEGERGQAVAEAERLRGQLAEAGLSSELRRREEAMGHEEELQELRLAYGRLLEERIALEGRLAESGGWVGEPRGDYVGAGPSTEHIPTHHPNTHAHQVTAGRSW